MRFVDTNVLIRFLTQDVTHLAEQATSWITEATPNELIIEEAVLVELTFVLAIHKNYEMPRTVIAQGIRKLSSLSSISMSQDAINAIEYYEKLSKLDFVDCLLLVKSGKHAHNLLTFDKDLLNSTKST